MSEQPLPPYNDRAMNTASLKVPPHSVEAEMSVLGGLMLSAERWIDVVEICKSSDFYRPQHQLIFEAMISLADDDEPLDAVTVSEKLQSNGMLERAEYPGRGAAFKKLDTDGSGAISAAEAAKVQ